MRNAQATKPPVPTGAHGTDTTISSATTLTGTPANGGWLKLQAFTQSVRYTEDGITTPTATVGFQLLAGEKEYISIGAGQTVQVIEETASASVQWQWYGW